VDKFVTVWCEIFSGLHIPKMIKIDSLFTELFEKCVAFLDQSVRSTHGWLNGRLTSAFSTKTGHIRDKVLGGDVVQPG